MSKLGLKVFKSKIIFVHFSPTKYSELFQLKKADLEERGASFFGEIHFLKRKKINFTFQPFYCPHDKIKSQLLLTINSLPSTYSQIAMVQDRFFHQKKSNKFVVNPKCVCRLSLPSQSILNGDLF
jgi:hypothetical protein